MQRNSIIAALLGITLTASVVSASPSIYYIEDYCHDSSLSMDDDVLVLLSRTKSYESDMDCSYTINTNGHEFLLIKVLKMDLERSPNCEAAKLEVRNGPTSKSPVISHKGGLCGDYLSPLLITTGDSVTFTFTSNGGLHMGGFEMLVTAFSTGSCGIFDFNCFNGRCVSDYVQCNGYDNCGDGSDELDCGLNLNSGIVSSIVVVAFLFFALMIALIVHNVKRRRGTVVRRPKPPTVAYGAEPISPPPYTETSGLYPSALPPPYSEPSSGYSYGSK